MKIIINTTGFIGSILLILYGLLADGWITPAQVNYFSQQYGYLNLVLIPLIGGLGYYLSMAFKPTPQTQGGNDQFNDLMAAAYGQKPSLQIEEQPIRRRINQ